MTKEILKVGNLNVEFRAIGCAGSISAAAALIELVKEKSIEDAIRVSENGS